MLFGGAVRARVLINTLSPQRRRGAEKNPTTTPESAEEAEGAE
jgi:hypothetical protein